MSIIDIYNKYNWVFIGIKKKVLRLLKLFRKAFTQNKTRVDRDSEFFNRSMKSWLQDNDIETYSTHYEGRSVVPERIFFIRTLRDKIYK